MRLVLPIVMVTAALALGGCGSKDSGGSPTNSPPATTAATGTAAQPAEPLADVDRRLTAAGYRVARFRPRPPEVAELQVNGNKVIVAEYGSHADALHERARARRFHALFELRGTRLYISSQLARRRFDRVVRIGEGE